MIKTAIVISASSDIGAALALRWAQKRVRVYGTYRTPSPVVEALRPSLASMTPCDLEDDRSVRSACDFLARRARSWDVLALCPGTLEPIGPFASCRFDQWQASLNANFTSPLRIVHSLLATRRRGPRTTPTVLMFAGGGTNGAPANFSAYTVSKIALIKMCELLDAEIPGVRFVIVGPGWVKTKIHRETLAAGRRAGSAYRRTREKLSSGTGFVPMERVLDCCDWLVGAPREAVGGRNFSVASDAWGEQRLLKRLARAPDLYKLRRSGNDAMAKSS